MRVSVAQIRKKLNRQIAGKGIMLPGAFNALTARQVERSGFKGLYISGAALSAGAGLPDIGLLSLSEFVCFARYIVQSVNIPCICDADTGFGASANVMRTVQEFESIGLAGLHLEDQVFPKRCGHLAGKALIPEKEMCQKIRIAAQSKSDKNFLIIARTDARAVEGLPKAVERAKAYVDAGADLIFPEALKNKKEFEDFAKKVKVPLLANMTEFGQSPLLGFSELSAMGYKLVIFPVSALRVAAKATENFYQNLRKKGSQKDYVKHMQTRQELYDLIDYQAYVDLDEKLSYL